MKKIESLDELRLVFTRLLTTAQALSRDSYLVGGTYKEIPSSEPCVVAFSEGELPSTWRRLKPDKSTEVFRITKADRKEGPTPRRSNFYLVKLAKFLDKKDLYGHRETIADKTEAGLL